MTGYAQVRVYYARLYELMSQYPMNVDGDEVTRIRSLYCATEGGTPERLRHGELPFVDASAADAQRWYAATEAFQRAMARVTEQRDAAQRHLHWVRGVARPFWKARHALRNRRLRATYDATMERLRQDVLSAYRDFREQAGDLTPYVHAEIERRERERRERQEQREEERRRREPGERMERAAAMAGAPGEPVWGYTLLETRPDSHYFQIYLQTLEEVRDPRGGVAQTDLTPEQVQAALTEERLRDRYTVVMWSHQTRLALEEWHASGRAADAWCELTGTLVDPWPRITEQAAQRRYYGPSSTYFGFGGY